MIVILACNQRSSLSIFSPVSPISSIAATSSVATTYRIHSSYLEPSQTRLGHAHVISACTYSSHSDTATSLITASYAVPTPLPSNRCILNRTDSSSLHRQIQTSCASPARGLRPSSAVTTPSLPSSSKGDLCIWLSLHLASPSRLSIPSISPTVMKTITQAGSTCGPHRSAAVLILPR